MLQASRVTPHASRRIEITTNLLEAALQLVTRITKVALRRVVHRPSPGVALPGEIQEAEQPPRMTILALDSATTTLHAPLITEAVSTAPDRVAVVAIGEVVATAVVTVEAAEEAVKLMMPVALAALGQTMQVGSD